jgi:hypothetical protein
MGRFAFLLALLGACLLSAVPAAARDRNIDIAPYIEVDQVLSADVQNGDVLTYTTLAAGIDASVHTRRAEVQLSYRYEHRFAEGDNLTDADIHSGLARANVKVTPTLTLEGGALATRARSDIRGDAPGVLVGNVNNVSQVYSLYAGPTLATHVGASASTACTASAIPRWRRPVSPGSIPTSRRWTCTTIRPTMSRRRAWG